MPVNPRLSEAIEVFTLLGWTTASLDDVLDLPLGTPSQRATALAGLKSGPWHEWDEEQHEARDYVSVDETLLALFAIRVGVTAPRAVTILNQCRGVIPAFQLAPVIASRGEKYAAAFIKVLCRGMRMPHAREIWFSNDFAITTVLLVTSNHDVVPEIPPYPTYLQDWATLVTCYLPQKDLLKSDFYDPQRILDTDLPNTTLEHLTSTFVAHVHAGIANNVPLFGSFGTVLIAGVNELKLLDRGEVLGWLIQGLDLAQRPSERRRMVELLTKEMKITSEEIAAHLGLFATAIAAGDTTYFNAFGTEVLALVSEEKLCEVALGALYLSTVKAHKEALKALLDRENPTRETRQTLTPRVTELAHSRDKTVQSRATTLLSRWGAIVAEEPMEFLEWNQAPPLWDCPRFEVGEVSEENLIHAHAETWAKNFDVILERYHALEIAVEYQNRDLLPDTRRRLYEVTWHRPDVVSELKDRELKKSIYNARQTVVYSAKGIIPVLLSQPSYVDLSIDFADLASRLALYQDAGLVVLEPDLQLALFRLNLDTVDVDQARTFDLPVHVLGGGIMDRTAGEIIADYSADPLIEPPLVVGAPWGRDFLEDCLIPDSPRYPESLRGFPNRLDHLFSYVGTLGLGICPTWKNAPVTALVRSRVGNSQNSADAIGQQMEQLVRSRTPLPAGAAMNLLSLQQPGPLSVGPRTAQALVDAWERGLLLPGVADPNFLEWRKEVTRFNGLAPVLEEIAHDGLLSVVWPVLDGLLLIASQREKTTPGASEVAETMKALLPHVIAAVERGDAPKNQLDLPGLRTFAARKGSGKAVKAAQAAVALLH
ncbi:hypothetical protein CMUST_09990 [Corynebacterium mustelae]|uniref:Uncharacterized protein n=1 Tax=Corynebacterium mustelae TaxID=571915 RepID=A0A0G3GYS3_9CORY|nr:hypothetical protein [Corynebacterium mustelae]AKK06314.1 hypothetical protein CMUST_09990 [Corynebacterium mustelae]